MIIEYGITKKGNEGSEILLTPDQLAQVNREFEKFSSYSQRVPTDVHPGGEDPTRRVVRVEFGERGFDDRICTIDNVVDRESGTWRVQRGFRTGGGSYFWGEAV